MLEFAIESGLVHTVLPDGRIQYCDDDTMLIADPGEMALDEAFGRRWIALVIDTDTDRQKIADQLDAKCVRYTFEHCDDRWYAILNLDDCPPDLAGRQV